MSRVKNFLARTLFKEFFAKEQNISDATGQRESAAGTVKALGFRNGDITSKEFLDPEFTLTDITNAYNVDSYIRQGVDKYIDQIFKEGFDFYGNDTNIVAYIKLRFSYMAEATGIPFEQLLQDIADDVVKYANCTLAKARAKDQNALPPNTTITGLNGKEPIAGYFPLNVTTMKVKRDKNGTIQGWQQVVASSDKGVKFASEDVVHFYYKKEKGNAFGTSFLIPVLDDVRALRQAEEDIIKMIHKNIYPFLHVAVGDKEVPGTDPEVEKVKSEIDGMEVDGGMVTTNRVEIKPVATDKVINADPYIKYLESRVFTGLGVPAILFGRGDTSNRSTGDNMTSEMSDRIKAIQKTIEMFFNTFIIKELLMEGGYDPIMNPDQLVTFKFKENDFDAKVKQEVHSIYKYEHNAISEDEMRAEIGKDPITDRSKMFQTLITQANVAHQAQVTTQNSNTGTSSSGTSKTQTTGTKATNNKNTPTNQHGTKTSSKKNTNSIENDINIILNDFEKEILDIVFKNGEINKDTDEINYTINDKISNIIENISETIELCNDETVYNSNRIVINECNYLCNSISSLVVTIDSKAYLEFLISDSISMLRQSIFNEIFEKKGVS